MDSKNVGRDLVQSVIVGLRAQVATIRVKIARCGELSSSRHCGGHDRPINPELQPFPDRIGRYKPGLQFAKPQKNLEKTRLSAN